ncbi:hypothetical protein NIES4075_57110 [Tolypothrix sp. NIES-4075]|uniref:hypothetical protein n=1 Tax=Tolypothrix sp. NIES-4075 TaxID=2005459 RepID=UPI000B5C6C32|nr:hypothetical protein [Tolypothrix sp. NIES-4075]GAX44692.1 hypothetical protein NIES4075_57110 [Tolypothrix sp. NIES-4075]
MKTDESELKKGYYFCLACGKETLHDWFSGVDVQFYETLAPGEPEPEDVFLCVRCERIDNEQ